MLIADIDALLSEELAKRTAAEAQFQHARAVMAANTDRTIALSLQRNVDKYESAVRKADEEIERLRAARAAATERDAQLAADAAANEEARRLAALEAARAAFEEQQKALDTEIQLLVRGAELRTLTADEVARAAQLEAATNRELLAGNSTLERRLVLLRRASDLRGVGRNVAGMGAGTTGPTPSVAGGGITPILVREPEGADEIRADARRRWEEQFFIPLMEQARSTAETMSDAFSVFFGDMIRGFEESRNAGQALAAGFEGLGRFIAAQLAEGLAEFYTAKAAAAIGEGLLGHPGGFAASIKYLFAAGLFKALAGAAHSFGRGRGSGSISSGSLASTRSTVSSSPPGAEVNIYLIGKGWPADDPDFQYAVGAASQYAQEKFGSGNVRWHTKIPPTGSGSTSGTPFNR
jgi:hypothetical protein